MTCEYPPDYDNDETLTALNLTLIPSEMNHSTKLKAKIIDGAVLEWIKDKLGGTKQRVVVDGGGGVGLGGCADWSGASQCLGLDLLHSFHLISHFIPHRSSHMSSLISYVICHILSLLFRR